MIKSAIRNMQQTNLVPNDDSDRVVSDDILSSYLSSETDYCESDNRKSERSTIKVSYSFSAYFFMFIDTDFRLNLKLPAVPNAAISSRFLETHPVMHVITS